MGGRIGCLVCGMILTRLFRRRHFEPPVHQNPADNERSGQPHEQQQPSPVLHGMAKDPQKMPAVVTGNVCNPEVSCRTAERNNRKEFSFRIVGSTRRREKHARG